MAISPGNAIRTTPSQNFAAEKQENIRNSAFRQRRQFTIICAATLNPSNGCRIPQGLQICGQSSNLKPVMFISDVVSSSRGRLLVRCSREYSPWIHVLIGFTAFVAPGFAQDTTATRLSLAAQFLSAGNLDRAESELQLVLRASPREYRALDLLGVVRVLQHREGDAKSLFQRVIQSKPDFSSAHAHLGLLYLQNSREDEAVPELQVAIKLDPTRTDASDALLHVFRQHAAAAASNGDSKQALGWLIQARKLAPKNPDVQFEFATAALEMSLLQDAVDAFREALSQRKSDPLIMYGLGRAYGSLGRLDEARQQFARYITLRPDDPSGYCSLGITLAALQRPDEARTQFDRSIAIAPEQTEAYFRLGTFAL